MWLKLSIWLRTGSIRRYTKRTFSGVVVMQSKEPIGYHTRTRTAAPAGQLSYTIQQTHPLPARVWISLICSGTLLLSMLQSPVLISQCSNHTDGRKRTAQHLNEQNSLSHITTLHRHPLAHLVAADHDRACRRNLQTSRRPALE